MSKKAPWGSKRKEKAEKHGYKALSISADKPWRCGSGAEQPDFKLNTFSVISVYVAAYGC